MVNMAWDGEVARRLRALQQAVGGGVPIPHEQMASHAGCEPTAWQSYQSGVRDFPHEYAAKLKLRFGITLDWIYTGDASHNPADLQKKIDEALRSPVAIKRGPKGSKGPKRASRESQP